MNTTITAREAAEVQRVNATGRQPVVFVHGLWLLAESWDAWRTLFEERGYAALAVDWPGDQADHAAAHAHADSLAGVGVGQVADHVAEVIGALDRTPIVVGHSFGGLLVQIIAGRGLASATVSIDPAPSRGVLPLPFSALKAAFPVLGNPANRKRTVTLTFDEFRYGFANAVDEAEARELYDTFHTPAPGRPLFQAATANLDPTTEAKADKRHPERGPDARRLRREGQHRALGPGQRRVQAAAQEPARRHRDRRDPRGRPLAGDRQRLARRRRRVARLPRPARPRPARRRHPTGPERRVERHGDADRLDVREDPRHRHRRPRARPGPRALAATRRSPRCTPRPATRASARSPRSTTSTRWTARPSPPSPPRSARTWWSSGRRPRSSRASPTPYALRGSPVFGPSARRGPARGVQGLLQGGHGRPRACRPPARAPAPPPTRSPPPSTPSVRRTSSRTTRSPPARASS